MTAMKRGPYIALVDLLNEGDKRGGEHQDNPEVFGFGDHVKILVHDKEVIQEWSKEEQWCTPQPDILNIWTSNAPYLEILQQYSQEYLRADGKAT